MKLLLLLFSANVFCQTLSVSISNGQLAEGQTGTFSVFKSVIDVIRNRKPRFLGNEVNINKESNYAKDNKK